MPGAEREVLLGRGVRIGVGAALVAMLLATVVGLALLWPGGASLVAEDDLGLGAEQVRGTVTDLETGPCPGLSGGFGDESGGGFEDSPGGSELGGPSFGESDLGPSDGGAEVDECATVTVRLDDGPDAGEVVVLTEAQGTSSLELRDGAGLVLARADDLPLEERYRVVDQQRGTPLLVLTVAFALAVIAVGRWRGLFALVGLAGTFALLTLFVLPALLEGQSPLLVAVVGSAAIMFVTLYLSHGLSVRTTVALLGTLGSLALTGLLATLFLELGRFSGLVSEEAIFLSAAAGEIDLRGLLLAGIVIGALGVLDDVTVTQSAAVFELQAAAPDLPARRLWSGAMRIGRDHIAATVNTLVLAYAGASLPLLLLFTLAAQPVGDTLTNEVVAQEIVRTLVGSIGIVASVPLTTGLAVLVVASRPVVVRALSEDDPGRPGDESGDRASEGEEETALATRSLPRSEGEGEHSAAEPPASDSARARAPEPPPESARDVSPSPQESSRGRRGRRRGSKRLRAEEEAENLLRGLRDPGPDDTPSAPRD
jgi:uncharacterized membrane protein